MYKKIIMICLLCLLSFISVVDVNTIDFKDNRKVNVRINDKTNESIEVDLGTTVADLNIDNTDYDKDYVIYDSQTLEIENNNKDLISINNASIEELVNLPGIGIKTASKIIDFRNLYGKFYELEDIKLVNGIGDKKYEKIKEYICL